MLNVLESVIPALYNYIVLSSCILGIWYIILY